MSTKVIRNLGVQFCNIRPEELEEENLMKGGGQKEPVGKKKGKEKANKKGRKNPDGGKATGDKDAADP